RQRAALDQHGQVLRALLVEGGAGDGGRAAGLADVAGGVLVDLGRGDDLVVQHDRDAPRRLALIGAGGLAGEVGPGLFALALELDVDLPLGVRGRVEHGFGAGDLGALDLGLAELELAALLVGQGAGDLAGVFGRLAAAHASHAAHAAHASGAALLLQLLHQLLALLLAHAAGASAASAGTALAVGRGLGLVGRRVGEVARGGLDST